MANINVTLQNTETGESVEAPLGFSWTTLFFGFWPPVFRGDWKWAGIIFILCIVTYGLAAIVFSFLYNKLHIKELIRSGWKVKSVDGGNIGDVVDATGMKEDKLKI
ncbi:MAG: hypothetical protein ABEJ72_08230 [Candidatus Aenigmatarchaeota archaeon]